MRALYGVPHPAGGAPPFAIALPRSVGQAIANELDPRLPKPTQPPTPPEAPLAARIAKPNGGLGEKGGYNMRKVLEMEKDEYSSMLVSNAFLTCLLTLSACFWQRSIRDLCHNARLDFSVPYKSQESATLGKIYKIVSFLYFQL